LTIFFFFFRIYGRLARRWCELGWGCTK